MSQGSAILVANQPARAERCSPRDGKALTRWIAFWIFFLATVGVYYVAIKGESRSAFNRWRPQVREFWQGEDVYLKHGFPTPPIMVMTLTPFCSLDGKWAMGSWFAFKAVLTVCLFIWLWKDLARCQSIMPAWAVTTALLLAGRPIMGDLLHGNVNLWILFLGVSSILAYRAGWDLLGGMLLGWAVSCKLTPALLVLYFLWKRQWIFALGSILGILVFSFLIPSTFLGVERTATLLEHWADYMVWPYLSEGKVVADGVNQSLAGLLHRFGEHLPAGTLLGIASVTLLLGLAMLTAGKMTDRRSPILWHEVGLVFLVMLAISERSWKHHFVWLLPISMSLLATAAIGLRSPHSRSSARWIVRLVIGATILLMSTSQDLAILASDRNLAKLAQFGGAYVWASLFLATAHIVALKQLRSTAHLVPFDRDTIGADAMGERASPS